MAVIPQPVVGVAALALVAIGVYLAYEALGNLQKGWTIRQSDPVGAGEVEYEDGIVEVQGTVEQLEDELLTTKYTDTPAVAYDYRVKEHEENRPGDSGAEWQTVDSGTETQPFYVTDETGSVAVDPDGATISLDTEQVSGGSEIDIGPVDASTGKNTRVYWHLTIRSTSSVRSVPPSETVRVMKSITSATVGRRRRSLSPIRRKAGR
ncbi:hypothetical protein GJ629_07510 [Halapricum sp. CBA1109]|uniref:GIDE domain-containing protein n=1 Tax=Halapricum sp. CBA1109 TaxID=2668068 RepID=UPI0012FAE1D4|nr:GIDE domain-containing protein [Halapricum sp. CBA1109]MUV89760.1 hypothetical protein [Halapricum sp. CBA1109]